MTPSKRELLSRWRAAPEQPSEPVDAPLPDSFVCSCLKQKIWRAKTSSTWMCFTCHAPPEWDDERFEMLEIPG